MSDDIRYNKTTLLVSAPPHIRDEESIPRIMWGVVLSLIPAGIAALFTFGYYCITVVFLCVITAVITEGLIVWLRKMPLNTIWDGSAIVTGVLLAYTLPPGVPWYIPVVGAFFAIAIAKHAFGGLGNNIWNPALAARAFLQTAYPVAINSDWRIMEYGIGNLFHNIARTGTDGKLVDAITMATPLAKETGVTKAYNFIQLFIGNTPGCIGETSVIALLLGGIYLIYKRYIDWRVPVFYIASVFFMVLFLPPRIDTIWMNDPFYHIFAGGLFLGAFFMATDMVTTPLTKTGIIIFAVGAGVLTALIRFYSGYPEGVCYSILLMNTATPLIDRYTKVRLYGTKIKKVL